MTVKSTPVHECFIYLTYLWYFSFLSLAVFHFASDCISYINTSHSWQTVDTNAFWFAQIISTWFHSLQKISLNRFTRAPSRVLQQSSLEAESLLSIFVQKRGQKLRTLKSDSLPPCTRQSASHSHDQPPPFDGLPMPGSIPDCEGNVLIIQGFVNRRVRLGLGLGPSDTLWG